MVTRRTTQRHSALTHTRGPAADRTSSPPDGPPSDARWRRASAGLPTARLTLQIADQTPAISLQRAKASLRLTRDAQGHWPIAAERMPADGRPDLPRAIRQIHFPESEQEREAAYRRLVFDEFLMMQLPLHLRKLHAAVR